MPAHFPSGMLRNQVRVQNPVRAVDDFGQASTNWLTVANVPAHVEQSRTAETLDDGGISTRSDFTFVMAWHPDVSTDSRLVWDDNGTERTFNVRGCWDRDQRRRRLQVEATEVEP